MKLRRRTPAGKVPGETVAGSPHPRFIRVRVRLASLSVIPRVCLINVYCSKNKTKSLK